MTRRFDLHTHSMYSPDSISNPKNIIKTAIKKGLNGIAITDHDTIKGGLCAKEYETPNCKVIVGSEILTDKGEVIGLYLTEEIKSTLFIDVIEEIRAQNGIVIAPHPFDTTRKSAFHVTLENIPYIDGIEGFNARCISQKYNDDAIIFGNENNLPFTAGSDAHHLHEIGNAYVEINGDDLREEILGRRTYGYGKRASITNHVLTKVVKRWRRIKSY